jgi:hypothetical protein
MMNDDDMALLTLLSTRADLAPSLDEELLRKCYAIQNKYQFSEDRTLSINAMERLIDEEVAKLSTNSQGFQ